MHYSNVSGCESGRYAVVIYIVTDQNQVVRITKLGKKRGNCRVYGHVYSGYVRRYDEWALRFPAIR